MKIISTLTFLFILGGFTFSQQTVNEILKEISRKKNELAPYYSNLQIQYKTKQDSITKKYNSKINEINSEIALIESKIKEQEISLSKYKKQSDLYDQFSAFFTSEDRYYKRLYYDVEDCKILKKSLKNYDGAPKKNEKLIFALWMVPANDLLSNASIKEMYFWSDSTITYFNRVTTMYSGNGDYSPLNNYNSSFKIEKKKSDEVFNKMVSYLNFDEGLKFRNGIETLKNDKALLNQNIVVQKTKFENEKSKFSLDSLLLYRKQDSTKLTEWESYYKIEFPSEMKKYEESLILSDSDKKLMNEYDELTKQWNDLLSKEIGQTEIDAAFSYVKNNMLRDPYTASLLSASLMTLPITSKDFPNVKVLKLKVRGQNAFGAYITNNFYVYLLPTFSKKNNDFRYLAATGFDEPENPFGGLDYFLCHSLTTKLSVEYDGVWTRADVNALPSNISNPPIKRMSKPEMKSFSFSFHK
jgi:hypothetical protein